MTRFTKKASSPSTQIAVICPSPTQRLAISMLGAEVAPTLTPHCPDLLEAQ